MRVESRLIAWPDFKSLAESGVPVFVAVGAHEEHGPHCSLETDTIMSNALAERVADHFNGLLLPPIQYGQCFTTSKYPGTITLRSETLTALALDIARGVRDAGATNLIFVNGHFGNKAPVETAIAKMAEEGFPCHLLDYPGMVEICDRVMESKPPRAFFYHADEFETSVVLAACPEGVDMTKAVPCYPEFPEDYDQKEYMLSDFNPIGVFGDPTKASAEKGCIFLDELTKYAIPEIEEFMAAVRERSKQ